MHSKKEKLETEPRTAEKIQYSHGNHAGADKSKTYFLPDSTQLLDFWMHKLLRLSGGQQFPTHSGRQDVLA